jgi:hypothetical protein
MRPGGAEYGGQKFSRGALYLILQNRLYRGETVASIQAHLPLNGVFWNRAKYLQAS